MKDTQFAKIVVFTSSLVPLALLIWDKSTGELGADPVNYVTRTTGILALVFLLLSLTVTPLRRITGKNYWSLFRRMLGLYAFFYAAIHMLCFVAWYQNWSLSGVITETIKRPYIMFGMGAFLLMVPLAATSTVWAIKKMGNKKWKLLHKLVYISAAAAVVHFYMLQKLDKTLPFWFGVALCALFLIRILAWARDKWFPKKKVASPVRQAVRV